jgi:hypothetical protein
LSRRARRSPLLRARVLERHELTFSGATHGAPRHVRAASALARFGDRYVIAQDDVDALALLDLDRPGEGESLPFAGTSARAFEGPCGKRAKPDLEASCVVDTSEGQLYLAFGSGSTRARERIVLGRGLGGPSPSLELVDASALYAHLRARRDFSGSELNVEGAVFVGSGVWLFQRGNGASEGGYDPVSAVGRLSVSDLLAYLAGGERPELTSVERYDLGCTGGVPLGFTDAARTASGVVAFLACAEASPSSYDDGAVVDVALGFLDAKGDAQLASVVAADGAPLLEKAEGLAFGPAGSRRAYLVTDRDDPSVPASLCVLALDGPWPE